MTGETTENHMPLSLDQVAENSQNEPQVELEAAPQNQGDEEEQQEQEHGKEQKQEQEKGEAQLAVTNVISNDLQEKEQHPNLQHDISFHPGHIHLYQAPQQRQTWGDTQNLPRVNWGDLYFDLFFVAAAYNMGNILNASPDGMGVLYFVGTFFPIFDNWKEKLHYDSRFSLRDDVFHRVLEMGFYVVNATSCLHIRTVEIMSNSRDHVDMFAFSVSQVIFTLMAVLGYAEIYFFAEGQKAVLKQVAHRDCKLKLIPFSFYLAAAIVSGINFYANDDKDKYVAVATANDDYHRILSGGETTTATYLAFVDHLPIWLCFGASLAYFAQFVFMIQIWFPRDGSHKKVTIPINMEFNIHRNFEWIMLMLGAGILNLLIVDVVDSSSFYGTFYCGILTVVLLQYLHFRSQPHNPDDHALRRNKDAGIWFVFVNGVYSAGLLAFGASYKLFLYELSYSARRMEEDRILVGGSQLSSEDRRIQIANIFGGSMATVWFCSDTNMLLHLGLKDSLGRCHCSQSKTINKRGLFLLCLRACLIPLSATVGIWQTDPVKLATIGLGAVIAQLILRHVGGFYFPQKQVHVHRGDHDGSLQDDRLNKEEIDPEEYAWPNVTHPGVGSDSVELVKSSQRNPD